MVLQLSPPLQSLPEIIYPDRDGLPMSDNTEQFRWIVVIEQNLEWLYASDPNVFVAADLLWYPLEGYPKIRNAPDILVAFGRPKGKRGSYKQWIEGNIPPQVVFEILSPGNKQIEMDRKLLFYERHGVEEYYLYDPDNNELNGWIRQDGYLDVIESLQDWISPQLKIRFDLLGQELQLYRPDGKPFLSYVQIAETLQQSQQELEQSQQELEQSQQRLQQAELRARKLAEQLKALGVEPTE